MGRSVSTLRDSEMEVYFEYDENEYPWWDELVMEVQGAIRDKYPSFDYANRWEGENNIILENGVAEIAISEYCGLICISGRPTSWLGYRLLTFVDKFLQKSYGKFKRVGTLSNGCAVYEPIDNQPIL